MYPDEWEKFIEPIPRVERGDLMSAYYRRLTGDDEKVRLYLNIVVAESVMYAIFSVFFIMYAILHNIHKLSVCSCMLAIYSVFQNL